MIRNTPDPHPARARRPRHRSRTLAPAALLVLVAAAPPPPPAPAPAPPTYVIQRPAPDPARLILSATGDATATPDLLDASLAATAEGPDPAAVQAGIDRLLAHAADLARAVPGLAPNLGGYTTSEDDHRVWHAAATLDLESHDGPSLLALIVRLQQAGLTLQALDWRLSPPLHAQIVAQAERQAIDALRIRAANAADALGLRLAGLSELRLEEGGAGFRPLAMGIARSMAATPVLPDLDAAQHVTATASATLLLLPLGR